MDPYALLVSREALADLLYLVVRRKKMKKERNEEGRIS